MSLMMSDEGTRSGHGRRPALIAALVVAVVLVGAVAFVLGRSGDSGSPGPPINDVLRWTHVGPAVVPSGAAVGPHELAGGVARGFSQDARGAAVAALNISARISPAAGDGVMQQTVRAQCFGDPDTAINNAEQQSTVAGDDTVQPSAYWFKVTSGDPSSLLVIDIAAETPQASGAGGYVHFERTLRWTGDDWQMQVPVARPALLNSLSGYTLLGRP